MNLSNFKFFGIGLCLLISRQGFSQSAPIGVWEDALHFTEFNPNYTSRMMGIGGAQVGLGADISNAVTNPAGLGMLRRSEASFSPGILFTRSENSYLGSNSSAGSSRLQVGNLSVAFANAKDGVTGGAFRGGTFAISLSRTANFNSRRTFDGLSLYNPKSEDYGGQPGAPLSATDSLLPGRNSYNYSYYDILSRNNIDPNITSIRFEDPEFANLNNNEYLIRQGYGVYILDQDSNSGNFYVNPPNGDVRQSGIVETRGKAQQLDFAYGANFNDRFFIGGGIGIPMIDYDQHITYDETLVQVRFPTSLAHQDPDRPLDFSFWNGFTTRRQVNLMTTGYGINAKIGGLYKATDYLRLGASVQTPSSIWIRNSYTSTVAADFGQRNVYYPNATFMPGFRETDRTLTFESRHIITAPWKVSAGASLLSDKLGFVSAELTYIDYPSSSIRGRSFDLSGDNAQIKKQSKGVLQVRAGAEYRYEILRVRAGGGLLPDPFKDGQDMAFFSGGLGVRLEDYYVDVAFQRYVSKQTYRVYNGSESAFTTEPIASTLKNTLVQLTFGTYF